MNIKEWFSSNLKMKRWLFFILAGVIMLSWGFSKLLQNDQVDVGYIIKYGALSVFGIAVIVWAYIMSQKALVQTIAEATIKSNKNINIKKLVYDKKALDKGIKINKRFRDPTRRIN